MTSARGVPDTGASDTLRLPGVERQAPRIPLRAREPRYIYCRRPAGNRSDPGSGGETFDPHVTTPIDLGDPDDRAAAPPPGAGMLPFMPVDAVPPLPGMGAPGPAGLMALARLSRQAGAAEEAAARYREALLLDPDDAVTAIEVALYCAELGNHRGAVEILERCVRRHPELGAARYHLGRCWQQLAEPAKARHQLRRYLDLEPEDTLGAAAALATLKRAGDDLPAPYLRALFDQYADDFDRNLIDDLGYRAPQLLRQALDRCWRPTDRGAVTIDLGCGTGLGGAAFRDLACRMHGVDLSPRMIEKAAARNIYDALSVGDAATALARGAAAWDLVIAADMLVYLGDLTAFFAAVATALRPCGAFAASAEATDAAYTELKPTRRFGHAAAHLRHAAALAGLRVAGLDPASPRTEKGQPVPGHVMVLIKDA